MVVELFMKLVDVVIHLESYLDVLIPKLGAETYALLFAIIFAETGFVITPFLPGDSLLFAIGTLAARGALNMVVLFVLLCLAAIAGDSLNYSIGKYLGPRVFREKSRLFKREYLLKTEEFYEKHGSKTIILARFIPVIRTFAPFVAGIGRMKYGRFIAYNILGGVLWVGLMLFAGFFFGNIPFVKENFSAVIMAIIVLSFLPGIIEFLRHRRGDNRIYRARKPKFY